MKKHRLAALLNAKPLLQDIPVLEGPIEIPRLTIIRNAESRALTEKEEEACNWATD